jgi:hypothetical protein
MLLDVRRTHEIVETQLCVIEGRVDSQRSSTRPLIVVLARGFAQPGRQESWSIVDHHVSGHAGRWIFTAPSGRYAVAAFEDTNADYRYQRGEPFAGVDAQRIVDCNGGAAHRGDAGADSSCQPA